MANAVTFWKGTKASFDPKVKALGRIYFVTDDDNNGALYLGVQGETAVEARLISPARLTALTAEITDNLSTVTAKAVVDFVKAQIEAAFGADSAYAGKIAEIEGRLDAAEDAIDAVEDRLDVVEPKVAAVEGILAGFGGEGEPATVKGAIDDVKAIASAALDFKGVVATVDALPTEGVANGDVYYVTEDSSEYVYIDVEGKKGFEKLGGVVDYSVFVTKTTKINGKALDADVTLTGADIAVDATEGAGTVAAKLEALQDAIDEITGTGEDGDPTSIAGLAVEISNIKNYTVNGKKISESPVLAAADIDDVYSKTEVDELLAGEVEAIEERLTATEGVANGAAAAVATKVEQEAYNAKMGELDEALGKRYTKEEVDQMISDATLVWQDEVEA